MHTMNRPLLLLLAVSVIQGSLYGCGKSEEQKMADREAQAIETRAKAEAERRALEQRAAKEQIEAAIKLVKENLKDPASANFKNVRLLRDKPLLICGEVDAKNADGGVLGFAPFVVFKIKEDGVREVYIGKGESDPGAAVNAGVFLLKHCH